MKKLVSAVVAALALHLAPLPSVAPFAVAPALAEPATGGVLDEVPTAPQVKDKAARKKLLARHALTLQWIESKQKGAVTIWEDAGYVRVAGEQRDAATGNFVTVEGWITKIEAKQFKLRGRVVTRVGYIADGKECAREGDFTFLIKGGRKFWRLQEMKNTCANDGTVDYVDITIAPLR
jgi:hypothetical protein